MAPPKNDAFADLFLSANTNSSSTSVNDSRMPMLQRQSRRQSPLNGSSRPGSTGVGNTDNWSNIDILSGTSRPGSSHSIPSKPNANADLDPFSIFDAHTPATANLAKSSQTQSASLEEPVPMHNSNRNGTGANGQLALLLDDDFSDAFPAEKEPSPKNTPPVASGSRPNSASDSVLAQLLDIGFSVEVSNQAIAKIGPDLQQCVNYIMGGGNSDAQDNEQQLKHRPSERQSQEQRPSHPHEYFGEDISGKIADLSTDLFSKASFFFDKSKKTVLRNIDQFQQQRGQARQPSGMPSWMAHQEKYKKDAVERKGNGEAYEDYGSDEDNFDRDAIAEFIRKQKLRDQERNAQRLQESRQKKNDGSSTDTNQMPPKRQEWKRADSPRQFTRQESPPVAKEQTPAPARTKVVSNDELPRRPVRRAAPQKPTKSADEDLLGLNSQLKTRTATQLNEFQQTDFETYKEKASMLFGHGDYASAYESYLRCMESLPDDHDYRIVIYSNSALTLVKMGNYKEAKNHCDSGIGLINIHGVTNGWEIMEKPVKYWYVKLLSRKAESLEMMESFPAALECYMELVRLGVSDKKVMDGKRRVNRIVNPEKPKQKEPVRAAPTQSIPKPAAVTVGSGTAAAKLKKQNAEAKAKEEEMFRLHDSVHEQLQTWSHGKEDNIRALLTTLPDIIPARLGFPFVTDKKIGLGDLMLPKKVKISYMKVISAIHPDKLSRLELQDKMICQGVFVALNKAWDTFKEQNNMA